SVLVPVDPALLQSSMDNNKRKGAAAGGGAGGRPGEYEMLDRNMTGAYAGSTGQQPHFASHAQTGVSQSDLDVLETTAPAEPYQYDMYSGYHTQGEPSAPYPADAGVGYFHQGKKAPPVARNFRAYMPTQ
ncbi:hypothetical protein GGH92_007033, partial [Coemansia sp. RSA 2673]